MPAEEVVSFVLDQMDQMDQMIAEVKDFAGHDDGLLRQAHRILLHRLTAQEPVDSTAKDKQYYLRRGRDAAAHDVLFGLAVP